MVLNGLCLWITHSASLDLTCIWCYGEVRVMLGWHSRKPGLTQSIPSLQLVVTQPVAVSGSETCTLAHKFIIRARWRQGTWQIWPELLFLISEVYSFGKKRQNFWDGGNDWPWLWNPWFGFPFFFRLVVLSHRDSGCASIPTNLCF